MAVKMTLGEVFDISSALRSKIASLQVDTRYEIEKERRLALAKWVKLLEELDRKWDKVRDDLIHHGRAEIITNEQKGHIEEHIT